MKNADGVDKKVAYQKSDLWMYILGGVLIYVLVYPFMKKVVDGSEAQASLIATVLALVGVYTGKYTSQLINIRRKSIPSWWFIISIIMMVCLIVWLFIVGQFPIKGKNALNLIAFGMPFLIASLLLGAMIHLVRSNVENNLHDARIIAAQSQSELSVLQSQLSPHFLFNTLNNMYGISITQHEKIPVLLLKLSELLRYSLYETKGNLVPLVNEINYINNYLEFERLRMGDRLHLKTAMEQISDTSIMIAPMLFIVFVENAVKHGKDTADEKVYIDMELRTWGTMLLFSITNSGSNIKYGNEQNSGLGLLNVKKRLELLYPQAYDLQINAGEKEFRIMLQVNLKQHERL